MMTFKEVLTLTMFVQSFKGIPAKWQLMSSTWLVWDEMQNSTFAKSIFLTIRKYPKNVIRQLLAHFMFGCCSTWTEQKLPKGVCIIY